DVRMHTLPEDRAGPADHRAFDDVFVRGENRFDLRRIDFMPTAIEHVLLAIEHADEALGIDTAEIAGVPEAAGKFLLSGGGIVPVTAHDRRTANPDFAD